MTGAGIRIDAEVAQPLELKAILGRRRCEARLQLCAPEYFERMGIQVIEKIFCGGRIFDGEEPIVQPYLGIQRAPGGNPMERRFYFAPVR